MDNIIDYITKSKELLAALLALALFAIAAYQQIMAAIHAAAAKKDLVNLTKGLITTAEETPVNLINSLTLSDVSANLKELSIDPGTTKNLAVAQKLIETEKPLLKKAKINAKDIVEVGNFVNTVYQGIKGLIHSNRKK